MYGVIGARAFERVFASSSRHNSGTPVSRRDLKKSDNHTLSTARYQAPLFEYYTF